VQEHLERLFETGVFPWWTVLEPPFWRGVVLQLPLGLLACIIVRLLQRTASVIAQVVVARGGSALSAGVLRLTVTSPPASWFHGVRRWRVLPQAARPR